MNEDKEFEEMRILEELKLGDKKRRLEVLMKIPLDPDNPDTLKNIEETTAIIKEMTEFLKNYPQILETNNE